MVVSVTAGRWLAGGTAQPRRTAKLPGASRARGVWGWLAHGHGFGLRVSLASRVGDEDERVARIGLPGVPTSTWFAAGTRRLAGDYAAAPGLELGTQLGLDPRRHGHGYQNQTRAAGQGGAWALAERILCVCVCVCRERGQEIFRASYTAGVVQVQMYCMSIQQPMCRVVGSLRPSYGMYQELIWYILPLY